jgi:DNA-binding SARP family transcriptional activator
VRFRVLGSVEVETGEGRILTLPRRHERCLLGILLLQSGRTVSIDRLFGLLWNDDPPAGARRAVHTYVARIRALLNQAGAEEHGVRLDGLTPRDRRCPVVEGRQG